MLRKSVHHLYRPAVFAAVSSALYNENEHRCFSANNTTKTSCSALAFLWGGEDMRARNNSLRRHATMAALHSTATKESVDQVYDVEWKTPLGSGMFGDVYQGRNRKTMDKVAIKKISKKFTNNDAFTREMANLLMLEKTGGHPSICLMRQHFEDDDYFYLVLDLVEGGEVFEHLCQHGAYSEADAARLIRQTASALAFLHGIGMVHSDLKPENLMLSSKDEKNASVKIVDFGCAHQISSHTSDGHTEHRGTGLTPAYCPPEVLAPKKKDPHSHCEITPAYDMWSLGVITYVLLTGAHPYDLRGRASNEELEDLIISGKPPPTRNCKYTRKLSEDAILVIESMMNQNPNERITAEELLHNPWVRGETASSTAISGSDSRLAEYHRHETKVATSIFKQLMSNSDKHGGSHQAKKTNILELAFNDLDPANRGYISTSELYGMTSFLAADAKLSLNELRHLLRENITPKHFSAGTVIAAEGDKGDSMYFVQSGTVEVVSKADGFSTIRKPGDYFGLEVTRQEDSKYTQTATARTPVNLLRVSREHFQKYIQDDDVQMTIAETDRKGKRERAKIILGLQKSLKQSKYKAGQVLLGEGTKGDSLYILEEGAVDISVQGKKVRSLRLGEMTGEHAAFYAAKPYNVTAQCMDPKGCVMQVLKGKHLRKMCEQNEDLHDSFRDIILRRDFKKALVKKTKRDFPENEDDLRIAFNVIANQTTNSIMYETLKEAVEEWDESYTDEHIRDMLQSLDLRGDGELSWEDFRRIFSMFNDM